MKILFCLFFNLFFLAFQPFVFGLDKNDERVKFLADIQTLRSDFIQKNYNATQETDDDNMASGLILVKKPNSVLVEHKDENMHLKFSSINGRTKIFDFAIGQTTYFDTQYSELMQFFTNNLQAEKLFANKDGYICLDFQYLETKQIACLDVDAKNETIKTLSLYTTDANGNSEGKSENNDGGKKQNVYKVFDIIFKNVEINKSISDDEFVIKDNRIFDDED